MLHMIEQVEYWGNKLPNPFWLFCILMISIAVLSEGLERGGVSVTRPETQILKTEHEGQRTDGRAFHVDGSFEPFIIDMEASSHSSRLKNLFVEI
jgi:hypothetical protein